MIALLLPVLVLAASALAQESAPAAAASKGAAGGSQTPAPSSAALPRIEVECSPASRAALLVGQPGCVAGRVYHVTVGKSGIVHLGMCPRGSKCSFSAVVHAHDRARVGDLSYLRGHLIAVTGDITSLRGHPQIRIKDRRQLRLTADQAPSQFDADRAAPAFHPQSAGGKQRAW